jgi:hypothetical protein
VLASRRLEMAAERRTRFSDVCGTIDELKRLLRDEPAPDVRVMAELLEDIRFMLARMEQRLQEYADFERAAQAALARLRTLGASRLEEALAATSQVSAALEDGQPSTDTVEAVCTLAEQVRDAANDQERKLRQGREAAIAVYRLYIGLRGNRDWSLEESAEAAAADRETVLAAQWGSWLPPPPHRERILDYLTRGRASVLPPDGERAEPYVDFEDGGRFPLRQARWSDEVQNFYPAGREPHPSGRQHRVE